MTLKFIFQSSYWAGVYFSITRWMLSFTLSISAFGIPVLKGNPKDMIMPGSVFVSEHFARETFGDADPIVSPVLRLVVRQRAIASRSGSG